MDRLPRHIAIALMMLLISVISVSAQDEVKWMDWEDAIAASKLQNKKVLVDIYTQWCGWCKKMDQTTYQNPFIVEYINQNYIAVRFDAEVKNDIEFKGTTYSFVRRGKKGYHELAAMMTKNNLRYPTLAFLNEDQELIQSIPGFQNSENLEIIMTYIHGGHYMSTPWYLYRTNYKRPDSLQGIVKPQLTGQKDKNK